MCFENLFCLTEKTEAISYSEVVFALQLTERFVETCSDVSMFIILQYKWAVDRIGVYLVICCKYCKYSVFCAWNVDRNRENVKLTTLSSN